jgi:hypothetical protein
VVCNTHRRSVDRILIPSGAALPPRLYTLSIIRK